MYCKYYYLEYARPKFCRGSLIVAQLDLVVSNIGPLVYFCVLQDCYYSLFLADEDFVCNGFVWAEPFPHLAQG